ncbi:protein of unknown function DUF58 [Patulibacter medicamentivorans]|uniref:DUF58 domain-containing protein n=1 Tax=Patulibacter medicamentivorans TaxID=1097667 RepID=H0E5B6_9ACTN|nr:DUF58 domain-containing protein [Patulibacter medicamentivorans]EHN11129.1 protein of unknown function DUF58 [Patulibacter medicamentivorans]
MSPTPRVAVAVAACGVLAILLPGWLCLLLTLAIVVATVVDGLLARRHPPRLRVDAPAIAPRGLPVAVTVRPEPPEPGLRLRLAGLPSVAVEGGEGRGVLDARVTARRRGHHRLPAPVARRTGPLRLGRWDHGGGEGPAIRVLPDYRTAHRLAIAIRSGRATTGLRRQGPLGLGTDFDHVRDYAPEDDIRQVNWRASDRLGRPMSNQRRVEADRDAVLLVDSGRLGAAPSGAGDGSLLLDRWLDAAAAVAATADALDDHVGTIAYDARIRRRLAPRRAGGDAVVRALHDLDPRPVDSDHERAFRAVGGSRRAFVLVLTDLLDEAAAGPLLAAAPVLARRHALCVAAIEEPRLRALATTAPEDEVGALAQAVAVDVRAARDAVALRLRAAGAVVLSAPPDALAATCVRAYLRAKRRVAL